MNQKRTLSLNSPHGVGQTVIQPRIRALVTGLVGLLLLALTACAQVPVGGLVAVPVHPVEAVASTAASENAATADPAFLAANPELMLARRYTAAPLVASLAANPELMLAHRYPAAVQADAEAATLSANPELSTARYYAPYTTDDQAALASFLAANPELMAARRYIPPGGWTRRMPQHIPLQNKVDPDGDIGLLEFFKPQTIKAVSTPDPLRNKVDPDSDIGLLEFFKPQTINEVSTPDQLSYSMVLNPELSVARRYAAPLEAMDDPGFLAANPELMLARRYTAAVQAGAQAATLAANPELTTARHYVPYTIDHQVALDSFLSANPELMLARRYIAAPMVASVALNPELSTARRYAALLEATDDPAFLAANPELMVARRYATLVESIGVVDELGEK